MLPLVSRNLGRRSNSVSLERLDPAAGREVIAAADVDRVEGRLHRNFGERPVVRGVVVADLERGFRAAVAKHRTHHVLTVHFRKENQFVSVDLLVACAAVKGDPVEAEMRDERDSCESTNFREALVIGLGRRS